MSGANSSSVIRSALLAWYVRRGRARLPWRTVRDPYYTLVSEFMLQQTQVDRVVPRFEAFVARFPDFAALARASLADVLRAWKGLGYNSRAVRLRAVAEAVETRYGGTMPSDAGELRSLPGIGRYTAAAIRAFAFDLDDAPVDTNVRRIVHRACFGIEHPRRASARELDERARALVPPGRAHDWNSSLMDLGASICTARAPKCSICPLRRGCAAAPIDPASLERLRKSVAKTRSPQEAVPFEKTTRYARGRIVDRLRDLGAGERISLLDLHRVLEPVLPDRSLDDVRGFVSALERDGLLASDGERIALRE
ncbi:MAG: A/G-specific adenine glycosylase [Candidatus Tumulicola sp.]